MLIAGPPRACQKWSEFENFKYFQSRYALECQPVSDIQHRLWLYSSPSRMYVLLFLLNATIIPRGPRSSLHPFREFCFFFLLLGGQIQFFLPYTAPPKVKLSLRGGPLWKPTLEEHTGREIASEASFHKLPYLLTGEESVFWLTGIPVPCFSFNLLILLGEYLNKEKRNRSLSSCPSACLARLGGIWKEGSRRVNNLSIYTLIIKLQSKWFPH